MSSTEAPPPGSPNIPFHGQYPAVDRIVLRRFQQIDPAVLEDIRLWLEQNPASTPWRYIRGKPVIPSGGGTGTVEVNVSTGGPTPRVGELLWVDTDAPGYIPAVGGQVATWRWDNGLSGAVANGKLAMDAASWAAVTQLRISELTDAGTDVSVGLGNVHSGTNIIIQQQDDSTRWARYTAAGAPVDLGTYRTIAVTYADSGALPATNNTPLLVFFGIGGGGGTVSDATTTSKGIVQLAGDLAGTAASPQLAAGAIVDADVNAAAAIAESKLSLATDAAAGTGSRRTLGSGAQQAMPGNRTLDAITAPAADVSLNTHKLTNVVNPTLAQDAATKAYVDSGDAAGLIQAPATDTRNRITRASGGYGLSMQVTADAADRWRLKADGTAEWGDGTATPDTNLYRKAADTLASDDNFNQYNTAGDANPAMALDKAAGGAGKPGMRLGAGGATTTDASLWRQAAANIYTNAAWRFTTGSIALNDSTAVVTIVVSGAGAGVAFSKGITVPTGQYIGNAGAGGLQFGTDVGMGRTAADVLEMAAGDTFKASAAGIAFSDASVQTTAAPRYYSSATHAAGTSISIPQTTHGCRASRGLLVQAQDETSGAVELPDIVVAANGDVTVTYAASVAANSKRVTVIG